MALSCTHLPSQYRLTRPPPPLTPHSSIAPHTSGAKAWRGLSYCLITRPARQEPLLHYSGVGTPPPSSGKPPQGHSFTPHTFTGTSISPPLKATRQGAGDATPPRQRDTHLLQAKGRQVVFSSQGQWCGDRGEEGSAETGHHTHTHHHALPPPSLTNNNTNSSSMPPPGRHTLTSKVRRGHSELAFINEAVTIFTIE